MLDQLLDSQLRARVLAELMLHADRRYAARDLAERIDADAADVSGELDRLVELGIATRGASGERAQFQADVGCPVFAELQGLVIKTIGVVQPLREPLQALADRIDAAFVFGSVARGELMADSDIDLIVIGSVKLREVIAALAGATERLDREVNPTVYSAAQWKEKAAGNNHFVRTVIDEPRLWLIGDESKLR